MSAAHPGTKGTEGQGATEEAPKLGLWSDPEGLAGTVTPNRNLSTIDTNPRSPTTLTALKTRVSQGRCSERLQEELKNVE